MKIDLRTEGGLKWRGRPVAGERIAAFFAALIAHAPRECSVGELIDAIWDDAAPVNPKKALQVLVARARRLTAAEVIESTAAGYRLGLEPQRVDVLAAQELTAQAQAAFDAGDVSRATKLLDELASAGLSTEGRQTRRLRALIAPYAGSHRTALELLETEIAGAGADEELFAAYLRACVHVHGPAHALELLAARRDQFQSELGIDPGPILQQVEQELLAADQPVRKGVDFEVTELVGREADLANLRRLIAKHRLVSIIGIGGLGKTRLAHAVGRSTHIPIVHFVDLTAVRAGDDLLLELAAELGVRSSTERGGDAQAVRASVRSLLVRQLDQMPTLLLVDNCEHVVEQAAEVLAFLVAATKNLRIVTTTRAALNIGAEQRYLLDALAPEAAEELFQARARAARFNADLPADQVRDLVKRLDYLPLAIELAAAKTRLMSVAEISERLADRFALLRGPGRAGPQRHQTMSAVLDWSWNLLGPAEQRALIWLALFPGGFGVETVEALWPSSGLAALEILIDQSLLTVSETRTGVQYSMYESVREFALDHASPMEHAAGLRARTDWALHLARQYRDQLHQEQQIVAMRAVHAAETNLTEAALHAIGKDDVKAAVQISATLVWYWIIAGNFHRVLHFFELLERRLDAWQIPESAQDDARIALTGLWMLQAFGVQFTGTNLRDALTALGPAREPDPVRGFGHVLAAIDVNDVEASVAKLEEFAAGSDPHVAVPALQGLAHLYENNGDPQRAAEVIEKSLNRTDPAARAWPYVMQVMLLAQLHVQLGEYETGRDYASRVIAVLNELEATEELRTVHAIFVVAALHRGDYEAAERELKTLEEYEKCYGSVGLSLVQIGWAELALARGEIDRGLALYEQWRTRGVAAGLPDIVEQSSLAPWILFSDAATLVAFARFGTASAGEEIFRSLWARLVELSASEVAQQDYPALGMVLFALAIWGLKRGALPGEQAVWLAGLAKAMAYNRISPSMAWQHIIAPAEAAAPGLLAKVAQQTRGLRGRQLLPFLNDVLKMSDPAYDAR